MITRTLVLSALVSLLWFPLLAQQSSQVAGTPAPAAEAEHTQPGPGDHVLEDGIPVKLRLIKTLSSADAKAEQEIIFEVVDDIDVDGVTVLRRGTSAIGIVTQAVAKKRMGRAGKLGFRIDFVPLADSEKARLRASSNSQGDSHVAGMVDLMLNMPMVSAPFFLLLKGTDTSIPKGTEITAFIDGDIHLDWAKFGGVRTTLVVDSTPAEAEVEIDGNLVGRTPLTAAVVPGNHLISVKKKGFTDWSKTLEVTSEAVRVNAELVTENQWVGRRLVVPSFIAGPVESEVAIDGTRPCETW
jgi:hypothetical protein